MKITYFGNLIELGKHNMKMTWKTLKQATGKTKTNLISQTHF